jgi:beta-galactosidase
MSRSGRARPPGSILTALGGDFGDLPNHGGFSSKGLVSAKREIFPKYREVKKVYHPVTIEPENLIPGNVTVKLKNRNETDHRSVLIH